MIYGYIRVSTEKQTVENQRFEINDFLRKEKLQVDLWIEETVSGRNNIGSKKSSRNAKYVLDEYENEIREMIESGYSQKRIAEILDVHRNTIWKWVKAQR